MISDLSNVKIGDIIWTIQLGYTEVIKIEDNKIRVVDNNRCIHYYFNDGKEYLQDEYPSAFVTIPLCFLDIKENDFVLVSNNNIDWEPAIFKYITKNNNFYVKSVYIVSECIFKYIKKLPTQKSQYNVNDIIFISIDEENYIKGSFLFEWDNFYYIKTSNGLIRKGNYSILVK